MLSARALIMPSFAEGLPVVLMEAMALGRPVLATYIAGIPELVVDGRSGWLFPAGSIEHAAAAIQHCLDAGESELRAMGEFARARALQRHDIDQEASKLESLFEAAIGG
jgi:glycosyltransferase involved in cell wall biosynthesis